MVRPFEEIGIETVRAFGDIGATLPTKPTTEVRSFEAIGADEIGFAEAFVERPLEKIPFSPARAAYMGSLVDASRRLQEDTYERFAAERTQVGAVFGFPALMARTPEEMRTEDIVLVEDYLIDLDEKQRRGYTTMGRVGQITSEMPAFVTEFILTGGLKKIGTEAAQKVGRRVLGKYASTTAGKAAIATGGFAMGTALRATGMPHRASNAILKRQVPQDIQISEDGDINIVGPVEEPFTSLWKGLGDHWIEIASEEAGEVIAPFVSKYFRRMPMMGKLTGALQRRWLKKFPGKVASDFTKKVLRPGGFHGVLSEVGEEYLGDITRAITNVEHFGAGEDADMLERIGAGVRQDNENLVPMLISFSIPGAIGKGADIMERRQAAKLQEIRSELDSIVGAEINTPTQIETAEGTVGYEDDFFIENWAEVQPKYKFDIPGVTKFFTPKWLLNRMLGVETLLEDVDKAELALDLERKHIGSWVNKLIPKLKKEKSLARLPEILPVEAEKEATIVRPAPEALETAEGVIGFEESFETELIDVARTKAHILQTKIDSEKPIYIMRDLLDTYDNAPAFLTKSETRIFNQVRELTRYLRQRANIVRERMGVEPIGDVKGYITHWMDATANRIIEKDLPIHSGYLYWLMRGLPKEVKNPTAMKRTVKGKMEKYFSKDLGRLLKIMTAYDLKDIYLREPYQAAWDELQKLRKARLIPQSTYQEVENYLLYDIRKHQAPMDKAFNRTIRKPIDLLNKLLPTKRIIDDPSRSVFGTLRRMGHISGLGFRLRPGGRNLGQRLLLTDLYRTVDYAKAQAIAFRLADMPVVKHPITGEDIPLMDLVREQDWYKTALHKFEDTVTTITGLERSAMYLYGKTHVGNLFISNVEVSAITGYFDWLSMYNKSKDTSSKHFKNVTIQAHKLKIPTTELLTQESDMMWNIREAVRRTQWEYFSISMPALYRSQFNRAMGMFQSWWMNYFFNHSREMINQTITGRNSLGRLLTPGGRLRAAKGLGTITAIGKASKTLFGIEMLKYLIIPMPGYLPPLPELITGLILFFAADDEKERKRAWKRIKYGLKFWIPFSAFGRDLSKLLSGEYDIADFLFYRPKEKK